MLGEEDAIALSQKLQVFLKSASAHWVALGDRAGTLLFHEGADPGGDTTILCALAAGSFAASRELARRLGSNEFAEQVHEGHGVRILLHALDQETLVIVVFHPGTSIGLVRYYTSKLASELNEFIQRIAGGTSISAEQLPESDFTKGLPLIG
jgi:predicted regulator of Ras-like GTPase activity (Roadblock/LC7/MglB family)